jgi:hypothetical protein
VKKHNNLRETHRYGDLRRQYVMFENQYIGFDALFTDYFTNQRYTLDQELEADMFALRVMRESGLGGLRSEGEYKNLLQVLEKED